MHEPQSVCKAQPVSGGEVGAIVGRSVGRSVGRPVGRSVGRSVGASVVVFCAAGYKYTI